jgi:hypothetical protein
MKAPSPSCGESADADSFLWLSTFDPPPSTPQLRPPVAVQVRRASAAWTLTAVMMRGGGCYAAGGEAHPPQRAIHTKP